MKRYYVLFIVFLLVSMHLLGINPYKADMLKNGEFAKRREAFMNKMDGGIAIFVGTKPIIRNRDIHYDFRQKSDFYYLTGFEEPNAVCVLVPGAEEKFVMFVFPRMPQMESWVGKYDGIEEAKSIYGADAAYPVKELESKMRGLIRGKKKIYCSFDQEETQEKLREYLKNSWAANDVSVIDTRSIVAELRLFKSDWELKNLQKAVDITANAQMELMKAVHPGMFEYEGSALLLYSFRKQGADREGCSFIVASGPNGAILHYSQGVRKCEKDDLLLVDIGAEFGYYSADITRTFPVDGSFSKRQKEVYSVVLEAEIKAIEATRPGVGLRDVMKKSLDVLKKGLFKLGLTTDETSRWQTMVWAKFFQVSHWLGIDIHDVGDYQWDLTAARKLEPGMVFTVEPGIYIAPDTLELLSQMVPPNVPKEEVEEFVKKVRPAFEKYKNISVRIEDDVLVTKDGYRVLSASAPKEVKDIEKLMRSKRN